MIKKVDTYKIKHQQILVFSSTDISPEPQLYKKWERMERKGKRGREGRGEGIGGKRGKEVRGERREEGKGGRREGEGRPSHHSIPLQESNTFLWTVCCLPVALFPNLHNILQLTKQDLPRPSLKAERRGE